MKALCRNGHVSIAYSKVTLNSRMSVTLPFLQEWPSSQTLVSRSMAE
jgi:hypothetical protein